jgi:hypothetical protein
MLRRHAGSDSSATSIESCHRSAARTHLKFAIPMTLMKIIGAVKGRTREVSLGARLRKIGSERTDPVDVVGRAERGEGKA